jgi:ABC-2 type transport system permease protein
MKYLKFYFRLFRLDIMSQMVDRLNFFLWMIVHTISLLTYIFFFKIIFSGGLTINGWNLYQVLLVLGVGTLITGLGSLTFFSFMYDFGTEIATGFFDTRLLKPLDAHFQAAFLDIDVEDLIMAPVAIILIFYSLSQLHQPFLLANTLVFLILIACSLVSLFSIISLIQSLAFKHVHIEAATDFVWTVANISKYPAKSIGGISQAASVLLLPIALISSVPAEVLFGRFDWPWIVGSITAALTLFVISRKVFQKGLRGYTSASS